MDSKLKAVMKSLTSTGDVVRVLNCQIEALEAILEHYAPEAFRDYQYKLYDLFQDEIKKGRLPNPSVGTEESHSSSSD